MAVDLTPQLVNKVTELQKPIHSMDVKLTAAENFHFTLKFLDDIDEATREAVVARLKELAGSMQPFDIDISGIGIFPDSSFIRVVWIGAPRLAELQAATNTVLSDMFKPEKPVPHLTIARTRSQAYRDYLASFAAENKDTAVGSMRVSEIKLKKSTLTERGPIYEDLAVFRLGAKGD